MENRPKAEAKIGLVLDSADPEALVEFWAEALGLQRLGAAGNYVLLALQPVAARLAISLPPER